MLRSRAPVPTSCHCSATTVGIPELHRARVRRVRRSCWHTPCAASAGFGGQAIAVPLLALILPFQMVLSAIVVLTVLSAIGHLRRDWSKIDWREIRRLLPYSVLGVLAGLFLLERLDIRVLTRAFGVFVILYACFALATASRPLRHSRARPLSGGRGAEHARRGDGRHVRRGGGPALRHLLQRAAAREGRVSRDDHGDTDDRRAACAWRATRSSASSTTQRRCWSPPGCRSCCSAPRIGHWLAGRLDQRWFNAGVSALLLVCGAALLFK